MIKVFISKYALTEGIKELEVEHLGEFDMVKFKTETGYLQYFHKEGRNWHRNKESAIEKANSMKEAKLRSLEKQIKALESLEF